MTYGEFAWKDLMRSALRDRSRGHEERPTLFVTGQPILAGDAGDARWSYKVQQAARRQILRPRLGFVVASGMLGRRAFSLRGLAAPVVAAVAPAARSLWVQVATGDRLGVAIGTARPSFPPRIDRLVELDAAVDGSARADLAAEVARLRPWAGDQPLGVHITLHGAALGMARDGELASLMAALGPMLGGSSGHPGEARIVDLRVLTETRLDHSAEVRLWARERP